MSLNVADYVHRRRGDEWERELARELRKLPEAERVRFIDEMLDHTLFGLKFANACLREKSYFEQLLRRGVATADVSSIRYWLENIVPRLGVRRVIAILKETVETDPRAVWMALYWLYGLVPRHEMRSRHELDELMTLAESNGGRPTAQTVVIDDTAEAYEQAA